MTTNVAGRRATAPVAAATAAAAVKTSGDDSDETAASLGDLVR